MAKTLQFYSKPSKISAQTLIKKQFRQKTNTLQDKYRFLNRKILKAHPIHSTVNQS